LVNVTTHYNYVIFTAGNADNALLIISINEDNNYLKKTKKIAKFL